MTFPGFFGLIALLLAAGGSDQAASRPEPPVRVMTIEQQMILRIPVRPHPPTILHWEEEKGPKCLPVAAIAGAVLSSRDSVDILLRNQQRLRARLDDDCDGLDYYGGLYLETADGQFCAKRDSIRSRMGGTCRIEKFKTLVPKIER